MRPEIILAKLGLSFLLLPMACVPEGRYGPPPTEHRLDRDAEARNKSARKEYFELMHRAAPGVDWRAIERENGLQAMDRRQAAILTSEDPRAAGTWREFGSRNQAGRMHCVAWSPDGVHLYAGADRGGLWKGERDGTGWTPLSDNLYGGTQEVGVIPAEGDAPDILMRLYGTLVHRSTDAGLTWEEPVGLTSLNGTKRILVADSPDPTVFALVERALRWSVMASHDRGDSFQRVRRLDSHGDIWSPRTHWGPLYVLDSNEIHRTVDQGETWSQVGTAIPAGQVGAGILAGFENPSLGFNVALQVDGTWELWRSEDAAVSWSYVKDLTDFWQSLVSSTQDGDLLAYAGVEMFYSRDGGDSWALRNGWGEYYQDPANKLHADIPGLFVLADTTSPTGERWYVGTDGGLYDSDDQVASVHNLSLAGLGVSQYYSVHTSRRDPNLVLAGSQDQGYQRAALDGGPPPGIGPWADMDQLISGDYGHLTSSNGTHDVVFSVYPGFVLVQDGEEQPHIGGFLDFPAGESHLWLPYIQADPENEDAFFFCATGLYRYVRNRLGIWRTERHSEEDFSPGYLSAIAFSPVNPERAWAVTSDGRLYFSDDTAVTWTASEDSGPGSHYFYGTALLPSATDPDVCWVGGSGYNTAPVRRTVDGGQTWSAVSDGLPSTLVYCLSEAPDHSGALFCGTENGAWGYDPATATWSDLLGADAPITTYWASETVPSQNLIRFATYGRGIWDYSLNTAGCFPYGEFRGAPNDLTLTADGAPRIGEPTTFTIAGCVPRAPGALLVSAGAADQEIYGGAQLIELPQLARFPFEADGDGRATVTVSVPNDPDLVGQEYYLQSGARDRSQVENVALSHGIRALVGD